MTSPDTKPENTPLTINPLRCFLGGTVAGGLSLLMYKMTVAIATTYATKPITSTNVTAINIASAVRTLVIGIVALGTGVFGIAALGLLALGVQLTIQRLMGKGSDASPSASDEQA